jgi:hypothetical protein
MAADVESEVLLAACVLDQPASKVEAAVGFSKSCTRALLMLQF